MAVTAADMIQDAYESLRIYAPGEQMTPPDLARGLGILNRMMDSWSNESLFCHTIIEQKGVLNPGQADYYIGDTSEGIGAFAVGVTPIGTPDWIVDRPLRVIQTPGTSYILDQSNNKYYVEMVPQDKWNLIDTGVFNGDIPDTAYYEPSYPYAIMHVFPVPTQAFTLVWSSYLKLKRFANPNIGLTLPPGYEHAIVTNFAILAKPYFATAILDPDLKTAAMEAKAAVKRVNMRSVEAIFDPEIVSRGGGYNIYSDRPTGRT